MAQTPIVDQETVCQQAKEPISRRALLAGSAGLIGAAAVVSGIALVRRTRPITFAIQAPIRQDWLDKRHEEIIEPDLPIVDPHHHLWDRPGYRYLFHDLLADIGSGHNIRATLFEECGAMYRTGGPQELRSLGETEFVTGVARDERLWQIWAGTVLCRHHRKCRPEDRVSRQSRTRAAPGGIRRPSPRHPK